MDQMQGHRTFRVFSATASYRPAMSTCGCEAQFNWRVAARDLRRYRKKGPVGTTQILIDALTHAGVRDRTLLDIGGGIGAMQHALLQTGAARAVGVDVSLAYLHAARKEAARQGHVQRLETHHGDFVVLANEISAADIVTLDRVICCYQDMEALVTRSADRARHLYGLVYPRRTWWTRMAFATCNTLLRLRRSSFRAFIHVPEEVDHLLHLRGLVPIFHHNTLLWQILVYHRGAQ